MTPDIFLSYNREDRAIAQRFAETFESEGFSVWWDVTLRSGEAYDQVTEEALKTAKAVVVLWSKKSVVSRWVRAEATLADRNRTLVPVRIEPCDLPIMFELTQTADLSHWKGNVSDPVWRAFFADVHRLVGSELAQKSPGQAPGKQATASARSLDPRPSIAVLPFINRSGLDEDDIFAIGMVEDLTIALTLSHRMKVIAASATTVYRTGARDLRQIGRDLGVRYLLEGNVRRVGVDLRVTAQLVEAETGNILWTRKFDRPLAEVGVLQEELITEVASCLGVEVQRAEMEYALRKPGDITAWEAVLRAEANLSHQTRPGIEAAVFEARRAIKIDPDYDAAHAILAIALGLRLIHSGGKDADVKQELLDVLARARAFESSDPIVLARIATALQIAGKPEDGLPYAERAVKVNPGLDLPHLTLGQIMARLGRLDDAIAQFDAADAVAPNGIWASGPALWRSVVHFKAGQIHRALEESEEAIHIIPSAVVQVQKIICLCSLGRQDEAGVAMHSLRSTIPDISWQFIEFFIEGALTLPPERAEELVMSVRDLWNEPPDEPLSR